jgi:hypothetical protein
MFQGKFFPAQEACTVQTRSEETGLCQHETLHAAVQAAEKDPTIWKISYQSVEGWKRILVNDNEE